MQNSCSAERSTTPFRPPSKQLETSSHQLISANNECSDLTVVLSGRPPILGKTPMLKKAFLLGVVALAGVGMVRAEDKVQLVVQRWRSDDLKVWRDTIIPAFTK